MSDKKPWWQSKTIWSNAVLAGAAIVFDGFVGTLTPEVAAGAIAVWNIALRLITNKGVGA